MVLSIESLAPCFFCNVKASSLVVAEHDGGKLKGSSLNAIATGGGLGESSMVSILLGGMGPALQQAASHASKAHHLSPRYRGIKRV